MRDLERSLLSVLERKAGEVEAPPVPPPGLLREAHRRQARTVLTAAALATVLAVVAVAGVTAGLGGSPAPQPGAPGATSHEPISFSTGGVRITFPRDWTFLALSGSGRQYGGPGPAVLWPILQVSNFFPAGPNGVRCPDRSAAFPSDGVMLYVQQEVSFFASPPPAPEWPVGPDSIHFTAPAADVCVASISMRWRAAGRRFGGLLIAGTAASPGSRMEVVRAFESMTFEPRPVPPAQPSPLGPKLAILRGTVAGEPWTFWVQNTPTGPCRDLELAGRHIDECPLFPLYLAPGEVAALDAYDSVTADGSRVVIVSGLVIATAARVELELSDGRTIEAQIGRLPQEFLSPNFQVSVYAVALEEPAPRPFVLRVEDGSGRVLGTVRFPPS